MTTGAWAATAIYWKGGSGGSEAEPKNVYDRNNWTTASSYSGTSYSSNPGSNNNMHFQVDSLTYLTNANPNAATAEICEIFALHKGEYSVAGFFKTKGAVRIARTGGMKASIAVNGGSVNCGSEMSVGYDGNGSLTVNDGAEVTVADSAYSAYVGHNSTASTGEVHVDGGNLSFAGNFIVGSKGTGTAVVDGGSLSVAGTSYVGHYAGAAGVMTVNGGTLTAADMYIGNLGNGTLNVAGGLVSVSASKKAYLGKGSSGIGKLNLNGGVFSVETFAGGSDVSGNGEIVFNGGTLQGTKYGIALIPANGNFTVTVGDGGGTILATNGSVRIAKTIGGSGRMTFAGNGESSINFTENAKDDYWTGGTKVTLGGIVQVEGEKTKAALLDNGLIVDGSTRASDGTGITVLQVKSGVNITLKEADLANVSFENCDEDTKARISDNKIVVDFVAPSWATVDSDTNWSDLVAAVGRTPAADEIVSIRMSDDHTLTIDTDVTVGQIIFLNGSGSTLAIANGKKLTVAGITGIGAVLNHGTLDKKGNGTLSIPFDAGSRGVFVVNAGTLQASANGKNKDDAGGLITGDPDADSRPNFLIDVKSGAVFDVNGKYDVSAAVRLAEGAQFKNSGSNVNNKYGQVIQLILDGNAKISTPNGEHIFAILARGTSHEQPTRIDLGEHTLEIACSGLEFALNKTTIIGSGTIAVTSGRFCTRNFDSKGEDCTLEIGANGTFENNKTFKVKNFVNNGTISYASGWGRGELQVTGNFESKTASFPALKLIGATIKARSGAVVTILDKFSTSGAITIDASEICDAVKSAEDQRIRVLTIPKTSYKDEFKSWDIVPKDGSMLRLRWLLDGDAKMALYVCRSSGTMIIVR